VSELKALFVEQLRDLLNAENQIVSALPKMVGAAHCNGLKALFEKHLEQTERHVDRLKTSLDCWANRRIPRPAKECRVFWPRARKREFARAWGSG